MALSPEMIGLLLLLGGTLSFLISTIAGGGGGLLLIPLVERLLGASATAPVVNLGVMIGRPVRLILFWRYIDWRLIAYYVPSSIAGVALGGYFFENLRGEWLTLLIGLFLISTVFQFRFGKKKRSFTVHRWHFIPLGFLISIFSTLVGGTGPVLNPFYLNYGLEKEQLVGTKTANSFFMGLTQIGTYIAIGALPLRLVAYGAAIGIGASIGSYLGKRYLKTISNKRFLQLVLAVMVISGIWMIVDYFT